MRRRRLRTSSTDQKRPLGDLRTTNRQDSTDAPAMAASSVSRHQEINFCGPQESSYLSLGAISGPNGTQTAAHVVQEFSNAAKTGFREVDFRGLGSRSRKHFSRDTQDRLSVAALNARPRKKRALRHLRATNGCSSKSQSRRPRYCIRIGATTAAPCPAPATIYKHGCPAARLGNRDAIDERHATGRDLRLHRPRLPRGRQP